jgi:hypothetical protein
VGQQGQCQELLLLLLLLLWLLQQLSARPCQRLMTAGITCLRSW